MMQYRHLEVPPLTSRSILQRAHLIYPPLTPNHLSVRKQSLSSWKPGALGSLDGEHSWVLKVVLCLAPVAEKSLYSNAFKHFLFSAFKTYLYLWPCLTFFTEFPFPFKKRRPRKTEMSYGSLSKKSPETPPSPGKFSSRVYETNINIYWMKFSVTFKLFAFQEDSKKSFCPWQVHGFLGLNLKIYSRSHSGKAS